MVETTPVVFTVIAFGLVHGINPSHGWPVAMLYSIHRGNPVRNSIVTSGLISGAHFVSSIAVVVAYLVFASFVDIDQTYLRWAAVAGLSILAVMFWREKVEDFENTQHGHLHENTESVEHEHSHWHRKTGYHSHIHFHGARSIPSLKGLAVFALVLGFAHEEEFVILALAAGGVNPILLMVSYATAVASGLVGVTFLAVKAYTHVQHRVIQYAKYLPKIAALILGVMAVEFATGLF